MKKPIIAVSITAIIIVVIIAVLLTRCGNNKADDGNTNIEIEKESDDNTLTDAGGEATTDNTKETTTGSKKGDSGSKQDDTAKSETTDSNKSDKETTQSTNSSETQHTHNWVAITKTVTITDSPATTRQELVSAAYDETAQVTKYGITVTEFNHDGYRPTSADDSKAHARALNAAGLDASYHAEDVEISKEKYNEYAALGKTAIYSYVDEEYIHHDAVYKTVNVPAVTHTEEQIVGYKCSCGATK